MSRDYLEAYVGQQEHHGYCQAVRTGDWLFVAGTAGHDLTDGVENVRIPESMVEQMALAYRNISDTLAQFGATMAAVVEQRVYVTDLDAASAALEVRKAAYAGTDLPASTMIEVRRLTIPELKVEIAVTAQLDNYESSLAVPADEAAF